MELKKLSCDLTICKLQRDADIGLYSGFCFIARTDEELSLVCRTEDAPGDAVERSDGWRAFRIQGVLDFSLVGILSKISGILAENGIGIFAVSTFNTDYILVKGEAFARALAVLAEAGYTSRGAGYGIDGRDPETKKHTEVCRRGHPGRNAAADPSGGAPCADQPQSQALGVLCGQG